jgi:hypothetical protein
MTRWTFSFALPPRASERKKGSRDYMLRLLSFYLHMQHYRYAYNR